MTDNPFQLGLLDLPESSDLGIRYLSGVFRHTTNSYKFYWFLAILEAVKNNLEEVSLDLLTAEMVAQVWYPVHYFRLNFGKLDRLGQLAVQLKEKGHLSIQAKREEIRDAALRLKLQDTAFKQDFVNLQRYVPTRFLSPWFSTELKGIEKDPRTQAIKTQAEHHFGSQQAPLYQFIERPHFKGIEFHADWLNYLFTNFRIVRGFVLWHLLDYLQQRNPTVPNLPEKLFPPQARDMGTARKYWQWVLKHSASDSLRCPYSHAALPEKAFSLDHFIPWSFVCHDQLWNLIPVTSSVNSAKSDALPSLTAYLNPFVRLQFDALQAFLNTAPAKQWNWVEDYNQLLRSDTDTLRNMELASFESALSDTLIPLEQIAANMGFRRNWVF